MKINNKKLIWFTLLGFLVTFLLIRAYSTPKTVTVYNIGYEQDASQHMKKHPIFVEWWYFDGHINPQLSFVLTFWVSSKNNWVRLNIYDSSKDRNWTFSEYPTKNNIEISYNKCNIRMGNSSITEKNGIYSIVFDNQNCKLRFELIPLIPGFAKQKFLPQEGYSYRPWIVAVPRGKIQGILEYDIEKIEFNGTAYHDHNYCPLIKSVSSQWGDWYWGRFFTQNYTVIMAIVNLRNNPRSFLYIFKDGNLAQAITKRNLFSNDVYEKIKNKQMPAEFDVSFGQGSMSIFNKHISLKTPGYTRYVNEIKIKISQGKNVLVEEGNGLSEFVY